MPQKGWLRQGGACQFGNETKQPVMRNRVLSTNQRNGPQTSNGSATRTGFHRTLRRGPGAQSTDGRWVSEAAFLTRGTAMLDNPPPSTGGIIVITAA